MSCQLQDKNLRPRSGRLFVYLLILSQGNRVRVEVRATSARQVASYPVELYLLAAYICQCHTVAQEPDT